MLAQIDAACVAAQIWPDIVLSGHAHLYERYTRVMKADGRQIPYVVAGNGGYYNFSDPRQGKNGANPQPGIPGNDAQRQSTHAKCLQQHHAWLLAADGGCKTRFCASRWASTKLR